MIDDDKENTRLSELVSLYENNRNCYLDSNDILDLVDYYMEKELTEKALELLERGLSIHPNDSNLKIYKVRIFLFINKLNAAEKIIKELEFSDFCDSSELSFLKAELLLNRRKKSEAEKIFNSFTNPSTHIKRRIFYTYYAANYVKDSIKYYENLKDLKDDIHYQDISLIADCYKRIKKYNKAIDLYNEILDNFPYDDNTWLCLGKTYFAKKNYEKAIESFDFCYVISNNNEALYLKGLSYFYNKNFQNALDIFKTITASNHEYLYIKMAECCRQLDDYKNALNYFQMVYKLNNKDITAIAGISSCLITLNRYDEALTYANKLIKTDNTIAEGWIRKGEILYRKGELDKATKSLLKAIKLDPINTEIYFLLGCVNINKGYFDCAFGYFKQVEKIYSYDELYCTFYAISCFKINKKKKSSDYFKRISSPDFIKFFSDICPEAKKCKYFNS